MAPLTDNHDSADFTIPNDNSKDVDELKATKLLAKAPGILQELDEATQRIMEKDDEQQQERRTLIPRFWPSEIVTGDYLGQGGFGVVHQVDKITLSLQPPTPSDESHELPPNTNQREFVQQHVLRDGHARYAIKTCRTDLRAHERVRARIDLAVEAKYLQALSAHPNIIKLRGMAAVGAQENAIMDEKFFILLDRLEITLDKKLQEWHELQRATLKKGKKAAWWRLRRGDNKKNHQTILENLMVLRLTVAYDLAKAFHFLHSHGVVYRDIKATNIGFDVRGDVKVFDFGFCKSLSPANKAANHPYGYNLTARVGSFPYMAPEVFKKQPYDTRCDVFSFAVLLWEILSFELAWPEYSPQEFVDHVFIREERSLPISTEWPPLTRVIIPEAWHPVPTKRPDMERIARMIHSDLQDMTSDDCVLHRTKHMKDRTNHSIELELSCRNLRPEDDSH